MTEPLFFDTDCISAFLWVNEQNIVAALYPGRIVIPKQVYNELSYPGTSHLRAKIDILLANQSAVLEDLVAGSSEFATYLQLTAIAPPTKQIGRGEAATIALAKERGGIVASNNLKDVAQYVSEFHLSHMTTGDILKEALQKSLITEAQGNQIWAEMLRKRRKLGSATFSDFLHDAT